MNATPIWFPWLTIVRESAPRSPGRRSSAVANAVCPHCTNTDTLDLHCRDNRCGWLSCTCGALIYSRRRHRHPRHRSSKDTCHDRAAAV